MGEYASSLVYFVQPLPAALLYPNHHFLTPCDHFLVRALTPPPSLHPSVLFAQIDHAPAASRCFWVASLSRRRRMPAISLATAVRDFLIFIFLCHFSLRSTAMPLQLISFEGVTAVRGNGRTNGQLISFSGLLPVANF